MYNVKCELCNGTGTIKTVLGEDFVCPKCNGKGKYLDMSVDLLEARENKNPEEVVLTDKYIKNVINNRERNEIGNTREIGMRETPNLPPYVRKKVSAYSRDADADENEVEESSEVKKQKMIDAKANLEVDDDEMEEEYDEVEEQEIEEEEEEEEEENEEVIPDKGVKKLNKLERKIKKENLVGTGKKTINVADLYTNLEVSPKIKLKKPIAPKRNVESRINVNNTEMKNRYPYIHTVQVAMIIGDSCTLKDIELKHTISMPLVDVFKYFICVGKVSLGQKLEPRK